MRRRPGASKFRVTRQTSSDSPVVIAIVEDVGKRIRPKEEKLARRATDKHKTSIEKQDRAGKDEKPKKAPTYQDIVDEVYEEFPDYKITELRQIAANRLGISKQTLDNLKIEPIGYKE